DLEGPLLDIGSGNGSPGLVLGLLRPDLVVTLLEPRQKRWAFLREAGRAAGRPEIEVLRARHDGYSGPPAQTVTFRALALSLRDVAGLVVPAGRVVVWGARPPDTAGFRAEARLGADTHVFRRD
ncbi:MAG TPA: RsmG family class I SAM-dependent methyltransferase, partial [Vicinamibacteria bacterium]|nr:RsmG family class I SAM-dependent methyltransferase [Vicinamibacteria bacterium]